MRLFLLIISFCLILVSGWLALTVAACDPIQRNILYLHVPPAICSLACFAVLFICSIQFLRTESHTCDHIAAASAEVGFIFATVLNATGMIFAHAEWGQWWTPSLRLITSALLWFLYVAYLILRNSLPSERNREKICAAFGIIAFIDVPLVFVSARFIRDMHRPSASFESAWQIAALLLAISGTMLLAAVLISIRTDILKFRERLTTSH